MAAPTAFLRISAAFGHHVPYVLYLCRNRQGHADIYTAEEGDGLANLHQVVGHGVGKGHEPVAREPILLPVVQHVQLNSAVIGIGVAGDIAVPFFVVPLDGAIGDGDLVAGVGRPNLYGVSRTGDGAIS